MKNVKRGDEVLLKVRVFCEPVLERGVRCEVTAVNEVRGQRMVALRGPQGQYFQLRPGDVEAAR